MPESAPVEMKQRRQISEEFDRLARERFDPQSMDKRVRADVALGFLPASAIGKIRMFTLADVGIAGSYDPETKKVVVMNDIEGGRRDDGTLAHEIGHFLDDSRWDLQKLCLAAHGNSDRALAVRALIEGSAMGVQVDYALLERYECLTGLAGGFLTSQTKQDLESDMGLFARASRQGRSLLQTTPKYVRERIVFPYSRGLPLAREIRILGGTAALDEAFANPPRSTEQVLHPEKLLERRDDPIEIQLSDSWLPAGAQAIHEDTLGELGIRQLFNTRFPKDFAYPAAEGWGGDRYRVVALEGRDVLIWHTEWDTEQAARRFAKAMDTHYSKRHHKMELWMSELCWGEIDRGDGFVVQIRRRGTSVAIVDGVPADENWVDPLLDGDKVVNPNPPAPRCNPLGILMTAQGGEESSRFQVLAGSLVSSTSRKDASAFSLLGGALFSHSENVDGGDTSFLFGLISWRTAPRQDLSRKRILISAFASDSESYAWSVIPILNAPAASSALGHREIRTGLWNTDRTLKVAFDPKGVPTEGKKIGSDDSVILGIFGHGWFDDEEPDGTPIQSQSWYGPTAILFSTIQNTHGPLGPSYAPRPETSPASAPAGRIRLQPGDVDESSRWQIIGDLLATHETQRLMRGGAVAGQRTDWNVFLGILASGGVRDEKWWFQTPLPGWAELGDRRYLLIFWGAFPILIARDETPAPQSSPAEPAPGAAR